MMEKLGLGLMAGLILPSAPSTRQREQHEAWMKDYERMRAGPGRVAPGDIAEVRNAYLWHGPLGLMGLRKISWQEQTWSWVTRFLGQ